MATDIQHALQELASRGLSDAAIGTYIDAPQSIITRLRNGNHKSTSFERGTAIFKLLEEIRSNALSSYPDQTDISGSNERRIGIEPGQVMSDRRKKVA